MRLFLLLLAVAIPCVLAGCASTAIGPVREASYTLLPGQSVEVARNASVIYEEAADSRCPPNVHCIWAGELVYHFAVTSPEPPEPFSLRQEQRTHFSRALRGARIVLEHAAVPPAPAAGGPAPSYPVTLKLFPQ